MLGVFRVGDLIESGLRLAAARDDGCSGIRRPLSTHEHLLYCHRTAEASLAKSSRMGFSSSIEVAGQKWLLECRPSARYVTHRNSRRDWIVPLSGLLLTALLVAYLLAGLLRNARIERLLHELSAANERLAREVVERKQAEKARMQSEGMCRSLVDNLAIGIATFSPDMELLSVNNKMREWFPELEPNPSPVCHESDNHVPAENVFDYRSARKAMSVCRRTNQ